MYTNHKPPIHSAVAKSRILCLIHSDFGSRSVSSITELYHYGVLGMKWGVRKSPDFNNTNAGIPNKPKIDSQKHKQFIEQVNNYSDSMINRSIHNFEKQINNHQTKIQNPAENIPNWNDLSEERQCKIINHWEEEIKLFNEQQKIVKEVFKERGIK